MERALADCRDWPGLPNAVAAVSHASPLAESVLESVSRVVFARHELPVPELQVSLGDADGFIGRVDFLWPDKTAPRTARTGRLHRHPLDMGRHLDSR